MTEETAGLRRVVLASRPIGEMPLAERAYLALGCVLGPMSGAPPHVRLTHADDHWRLSDTALCNDRNARVVYVESFGVRLTILSEQKLIVRDDGTRRVEHQITWSARDLWAD